MEKENNTKEKFFEVKHLRKHSCVCFHGWGRRSKDAEFHGLSEYTTFFSLTNFHSQNRVEKCIQK